MEIRVFLIEIACVELRNRAPSSDSTADDMIVFIRVHKQYIGPLSFELWCVER